MCLPMAAMSNIIYTTGLYLATEWLQSILVNNI